jgi:arylsulfatase A-like enzyme
MRSVENKGISDDTIIIFTTDHGEMAGSHKLIAKTTFYEESSKIPIIIKYPKRIKPKTVVENALVGTIDIMPSLLDLADVSVPDDLDGRSFKNEIINPNIKKNEFNVVYSQNQFGRMVRFDNFKYVRSIVYKDRYEILFDIKNDPLESENLINKIEYNNVVDQARNLLDEWLKNENTFLINQR